MTSVALLDTSFDSSNDGDGIIVNSIKRLFPELSAVPSVPTHRLPTAAELAVAAQAEMLILTGTNILSAELGKYRQWPLNKQAIAAYEGKIVFLGVGWWQYQARIPRRARKLMAKLAHPDIPIAARDDYTRDKLNTLSIPAVNTNCPTMWHLSEPIPPLLGAGEVVFTVTDYKPDVPKDQAIVDLLATRYARVVIWPQGDGDLQYLSRFTLPENVSIAQRGLTSLDSSLEGRDYVGTRLHAGVRASQLGRPSVILAVDNRGLEIGKDTNLRVVARASEVSAIASAIERHSTDEEVRLNLSAQTATDWSASLRSLISG